MHSAYADRGSGTGCAGFGCITDRRYCDRACGDNKIPGECIGAGERQACSRGTRSNKATAAHITANEVACITVKCNCARSNDASRESEEPGIRSDCGVASDGDKPAEGIIARDVAQGTCGAHTTASEREGFSSHRDVALEMQGGSRSDCCAVGGASESVVVLDVQYTISAHRGDAGVGIATGEGERAGAAVLRERSTAGDDTRERLVVGAGVEERAVVGNVSGVTAAAESAGGGDLQRAGVDCGVAGVGVVAGEDECAAVAFCERAAA